VAENYGDLNGRSGVVACNYSVVSGMNPVFTVYQE
jgi:hypothetical protein